MKLGIMQGRLSPPVNDAIQEFPKDWKNEFILLKQTDFSHIDWIVTKKSFKNNPLFKDDLSLLPINSICADNLIDEDFYKAKFLKINLEPICKSAVKNKIHSVTIPLIEDSSIQDDEKRRRFIKAIKPYGKKYPNLIFSFEFESAPDKILEVTRVGKNFRITYDTGNITSFAGLHSHCDYLKKLTSKIDNVHLKDRTHDGTTKEPGTGSTKFGEIFVLLRWYGYDGSFTMQTARGYVGKELNTALRHLEFFNQYILRQ